MGQIGQILVPFNVDDQQKVRFLLSAIHYNSDEILVQSYIHAKSHALTGHFNVQLALNFKCEHLLVYEGAWNEVLVLVQSLGVMLVLFSIKAHVPFRA